MPKRTANARWEGSLQDGNGTMRMASGAYEGPYSFQSRFEEGDGTNPEELIAAAHAVCYAMVINAHVGKMGGAIAKTHVTCTVTADLSEAGIKIQSSKLDLTVEGLTGIDPAAFPQIAKDAEGKCPVSGALRGGLAIEVTAAVK